jgi:hypothetical protein
MASFKRISKAAARKLFNEGKGIYLKASRKPLCRRHDHCEALRAVVASLG